MYFKGLLVLRNLFVMFVVEAHQKEGSILLYVNRPLSGRYGLGKSRIKVARSNWIGVYL